MPGTIKTETYVNATHQYTLRAAAARFRQDADLEPEPKAGLLREAALLLDTAADALERAWR